MTQVLLKCYNVVNDEGEKKKYPRDPSNGFLTSSNQARKDAKSHPLFGVKENGAKPVIVEGFYHQELKG